MINDKKNFTSKRREALNILWELLSKYEDKNPGNTRVRDGLQAFENYLKNDTDITYNEVSAAHKELEVDVFQAYSIQNGFPNGANKCIWSATFVSALRGLLETAWKNEIECDQIIQEVFDKLGMCKKR